MDKQDMPLTPKEIRELFITVRHNQTTMSTLSEQIKDIHRIVAGNGDYKSSLVGRMQIMEERQKVGALKQDEICDELAEMKKCLEQHNKLLEKDHSRLDRLESDQKEMEESQEELEKKQGGLEKTIAAIRNKAIGVGIGAGVGTGGGLFLISELIAKITGGIP